MPEQARQKKMPNLGEAYESSVGSGSGSTVKWMGFGMTYPLRRGSTAVDAFVVLVRLGYGEEFGASLRVDLPHLGGHVGGSLSFNSADCEYRDCSAIVASLGSLDVRM
jgi:hypothetical protein